MYARVAGWKTEWVFEAFEIPPGGRAKINRRNRLRPPALKLPGLLEQPVDSLEDSQ
jgi:hypothetical protein